MCVCVCVFVFVCVCVCVCVSSSIFMGKTLDASFLEVKNSIDSRAVAESCCMQPAYVPT